MFIKFTKDTYGRDYNTKPRYKEGQIYDVPDNIASTYITYGHAEKADKDAVTSEVIRGLREYGEEIKRQIVGGVPAIDVFKILQALRIKPEPSDKLVMPPLTEKEIENLRQFYKTKTGINANDLATILLTIYEYAKDTKDNKTLEKVSRDLLTLYRLTMLYGNK